MSIKQSIKNIIKSTSVYRFYLHRQHRKGDKIETMLNAKVRGPLMAKYLPPNGIGAELGVLKGNFSPVLFQYSQARELHLIDPWYFYTSHWDWAGGNTSTVDALRKVLLENKQLINQKRVFVHVQDDLQALLTFPDAYFDWVYIDSSHAYEHTQNELQILLTKVKSSGIICGDDWQPNPSHRHHGVYKAVTEFMQLHNFEIIYADTQNLQWFIKRKI